MFDKDSSEYKLISSLNDPIKIQAFLDNMPFNHEEKGETCMSAARVLHEGKAHCLEASFLACACLMAAGKKPLIISLKVTRGDVDHIIIPFRRKGLYGALSKTNHPVLRYRDPVYRSIRELVMSYFHEYFLYTNGQKTLLGYTKPISLLRYGKKWLTAKEDLWDIAEKIYDTPVIPILPKGGRGFLRNATVFEQRALEVQEWKEKDRP